MLRKVTLFNNINLTFIVIAVSLILSQSNTIMVRGQSTTYPSINLGTTTGFINERESDYYSFQPTDGSYQISLTGGNGMDLDLYLYDKDLSLIDSSDGDSYPEVIVYTAYTSQKIIIEVYGYSGSGEYSLTISETDGKRSKDTAGPLPEGYTSFSSEDYLHLYKFSNAQNKIIDISLQSHGADIYFMVTDTQTDLFLIDAIFRSNNHQFNPHNLYDSFYDFELNIENQNHSYSSELNELFLLVYILSDSDIGNNVGYNLTTSISTQFIEVIPAFRDTLQYSARGRIVDNGDAYWDKGEFKIYKNINVESNQVIDIVVETTFRDDALYVLLFEGSDEEDINQALKALDNYFLYNTDLPNWIYNIAVTQYGYGIVSYKATSTMSLDIAIFGVPSYGDTSISFELYSNLPISNRVNNTYSQESTPISYFVIPVSLVSLVILRRKK